ncbi:hypothetical protein [Streptomyces coffeae]|uniref:Uncharacterized protein n=1 Tax=Streptomyces coffeae TaxID=621382 RepID=A0ABS1N7P0_9ACTN|nr:hypothetical protein [Streptomyces coffeae]MBL1095970.1 hypothetical protein [Streptomyces coffeae]
MTNDDFFVLIPDAEPEGLSGKGSRGASAREPVEAAATRNVVEVIEAEFSEVRGKA